VAVVALGIHIPASAQTVADQRIRVEKLAERLERLRQLTRGQEASDDGPRLDTLVVGRIRVVTSRVTRSDASRIAAELWDSVVAVLGSDTTLVGSPTLGLRPGPDIRVLSSDDQRSAWATYDPEDLERSAQRLFRVHGWQLMGLARALDEQAMQAVSSARRLDSLTEGSARVAYMELATQSWQVSVSCFRGNVEDCRYALGFGTGDHIAAVWRTPEERRRVVEEVGKRYGGYVTKLPDYVACVQTAIDAACTQVLADYKWVPRATLPEGLRASVVELALELSGDGRFGRLQSSSGSLLDRLATTAGVTPEVLLRTWRDRVLDARPVSMPLGRATGWVAFVWVVFLAALAARSTRWRAG
jgi:hypothetical protein